MPRAGPQRLEAEAVQQVVDGLEAAGDAELLAEDAPHVLPAEGADAVGGRRAGPQALGESEPLGGVERRLAAAPRRVGQAGGPGGVVAGDPGADLPLGEQHPAGGVGGGVAEQRQAHRGQAAGGLGPRLGADQVGQLLGGVVRRHEHGGLGLGSRPKVRPTPATGSYFAGSV